MGRLALPPLSPNATASARSLYLQISTILNSIEYQNNSAPQLVSQTNNKQQKGLKREDVIVRLLDDRLQIGMFDGKVVRYLDATDLQVLQNPNPNTQFLGRKEGTTAIGTAGTLALFPAQSDWGYYYRTSTSVLYHVFNIDGSTLKSVILA